MNLKVKNNLENKMTHIKIVSEPKIAQKLPLLLPLLKLTETMEKTSLFILFNFQTDNLKMHLK